MVFEWSYDPQWLTEVDPLDFLAFAYGPLMNSVVYPFSRVLDQYGRRQEMIWGSTSSTS